MRPGSRSICVAKLMYSSSISVGCTRMFALGRPTEAVLQQVLRETGVTTSAPTDAMRTEVTRNAEMARAVGATGTPTFVIGERVLQGAVGYDALKAAIAEARAARRS